MIKLLLVDDEAIIREGILRMVDWERLGIEVTGSCENALSAIESMLDDMPDILMTDIKMPGMDGLELVERALTLHPRLQCVILSGYDEFAFAQKALRLGVREYLLKLCTKEEIEQTLERIGGQLRDERQQARYTHGVRNSQMLMLVDRLTELRPAEAGGAITAEQVQALATAAKDITLLREAYVYLVSQQGRERLAPQWGIDAVQDMYSSLQEDTIYAHIAQGITALLPSIGPRKAFVAKMTAYIHEHYDNPELSLQYLADHQIHMNADYIGKEFVREMGMRLSTYLLTVRMEHAKRLLQAPGDIRMYEIAQRVGLGHNPNYFSRLFCKYEGMTPSEFKNQWSSPKKPDM